MKAALLYTVSTGAGATGPRERLRSSRRRAAPGYCKAGSGRIPCADEVQEFGIGVTLVEPGPIRTGFAGRAIRQSPAIAAYERSAGLRRRRHLASDGRQAGDPDKMASLILAALQGARLPRRLILGDAAMQVVSAKLDLVRSDLDADRDASSKADVDDV